MVVTPTIIAAAALDHDIDLSIITAAGDAVETTTIAIDNAGRAHARACTEFPAIATLIAARHIMPGARRAFDYPAVAAVFTAIPAAFIDAAVAAILAQVRTGSRIEIPSPR